MAGEQQPYASPITTSLVMAPALPERPTRLVTTGSRVTRRPVLLQPRLSVVSSSFIWIVGPISPVQPLKVGRGFLFVHELPASGKRMRRLCRLTGVFPAHAVDVRDRARLDS